MTTGDRERLPQPLAVDAAVFNDVASRTLVVRLSEAAGGYAHLLWREAHQALTRAEESGWRTGHPTLWADATGAARIAFAAPGEYQTLKFYFQPGVAAYSALVGKPGLSAIVVLDRSACRFLGVRFATAGWRLDRGAVPHQPWSLAAVGFVPFPRDFNPSPDQAGIH